MSDFPLLEYAERAPIADTSLSAYQRILPTLAEREYEVFKALHDLIDTSGHPDATGGELAAASGISILSIRPRLTGMLKKGLIESQPARESRAFGELRAHPVKPVVPLAAVARGRVKKVAA